MRAYALDIDRQAGASLVEPAARKHLVALFDVEYQHPEKAFTHSYLHLGLVDCHIPLAQVLFSRDYMPLLRKQQSRRPDYVNVGIRLVARGSDCWIPLTHCYHVLMPGEIPQGTLVDAWLNMDAVIDERRSRKRNIRQD